MQNNVIISNMEIQDLNSIANILETDFDNFWNYNVFKSELENKNSRYIIAKVNNEIVGFAGITIILDTAEITNIVVIGEHMEEAYNSLDEKQQLKVNLYKTKEIFYEKIGRFLVPDSLIAAKASRGMKFENIVSKIIELV